MKELKSLISIKKIIALMLTIVFCIQAIRGIIDANQFVTIFTTVIGAYFGFSIASDKSKDKAV